MKIPNRPSGGSFRQRPGQRPVPQQPVHPQGQVADRAGIHQPAVPAMMDEVSHGRKIRGQNRHPGGHGFYDLHRAAALPGVPGGVQKRCEGELALPERLRQRLMGHGPADRYPLLEPQLPDPFPDPLFLFLLSASDEEQVHRRESFRHQGKGRYGLLHALPGMKASHIPDPAAGGDVPAGPGRLLRKKRLRRAVADGGDLIFRNTPSHERPGGDGADGENPAAALEATGFHIHDLVLQGRVALKGRIGVTQFPGGKGVHLEKAPVA
jgi:hypothetical protein